MGQNLSEYQILTSSHRGYMEGWEYVDHLASSSLVKNTSNNQIGEVKKIQIDNEYDLEDQMGIYQMRKNVQYPVVQVFSAGQIENLSKIKSKQQGICGRIHFFGVIYQYLPVLFADFPQLSFGQILYVLRESVKGYSYLLTQFDPVQITNKMIGINQNNQIKVWLNQNFADNHSSFENKNLNTAVNHHFNTNYNLIEPQFRDESEIVQNLLDVILKKCENTNYLVSFTSFFQNHQHNFASTNNFINQFSVNNQINIPNRLQLNFQNNFFERKLPSQNIQQALNNPITENKKPIVYFDAQKGKKLNNYQNANNFVQPQIQFQRNSNLSQNFNQNLNPRSVSQPKININFGNR